LRCSLRRNPESEVWLQVVASKLPRLEDEAFPNPGGFPMSTEIDLPFLPSAAQIRRREFASVRRGYDPDQVRDYLGQVAEQVETLEHDIREAKLHPASGQAAEARNVPSGPPPSEDPYERLSKRLTALLATADKEAEGILLEARADAARMLEEARSEADRIRVDAQARAEEARQQGNELLAKAKQEADGVLLGLSERRETLVQHLQDMQSRLVGVAKELEVAIEDPSGRSVVSKAVSEPTKLVASAAPADADADVDQPVNDDQDRHPDDGIDGLEGMLPDDGLDMPGIPSLELDFDDDPDD
jgi:cell division initiation protein